MGIFQGDIIIKNMIELSLNDLKQNNWLLDHIFSDLTSSPYTNKKYGINQINSAKEWLANNEIDIYLRPRNDKDRLPCIVIYNENSSEQENLKTMGDTSTESIILLPQDIGKPIPYVVNPFVPIGYDSFTGIVEIEQDLKGLDTVSAGMILVNPSNGNGFIIRDISSNGIVIDPNIDLNITQLAIVPKYQFYEAKIEHIWMSEVYTISCHVHGDVQPLIWLKSIVLYSILRYKQSLLEANGFFESVISSSGIMEDRYSSGPDGEQAFFSSIQLSGKTEYSWIKAPHRILESIVLREKVGDGFVGGIKILSNLDSPDYVDKSLEPWWTSDGND